MDKLKVHIDSHLIKSTSTVPDELKDLGVSVFNENEFEKGVLLQVDLQLAEYELNKIKDRMKKFGVNEDRNDSKIINNQNKVNSEENDKNDNETNETKQLKKRRNVKLVDTIEEYNKKKLKLESKVENYQNYLQNNNNNNNNNNDIVISDSNSESCDNDNLIKTGEMTPFGTRIYFEKDSNKPTSTKGTSKIKTSNKQMKLTDFETFLIGSEKKIENKKIPISQKSKSESNLLSSKSKSTSKIVIQNEPTDFEKFLFEAENQPRTSKFNKISTNSETKKLETDSNKLTMSIKKPQIKYIKSDQVITDFDKFLLESDDKAKEKKNEKFMKKKLSNHKVVKKIVENNKKEKPEKPSRPHIELKPSDEVISFIKAFEEDENDNDEELMNENEKKETNKIISRVRKIVEKNNSNLDNEDSQSIEMSNYDVDEDYDDDEYIPDDEEDEDEEMEIKSSDDSDVIYETDSDDEDKKRNLRKCNDDGDENIFLKRLKKLDKLEKELRKNNYTNEDDEREYVEFENGFRVPNKIWDKLYKFQKTGVKWLWELHTQRCGGILGDEMGLGKTIQMISFLASIKYSKLRNVGFDYIGLGPTLIITPTTLISQWVDEFHQWWPYFRVAVLHDIGSYNETPKYKLIHKIFKCNGILITTFSSLLIYEKYLLGHEWHYVILDEGHKIRNPDAKITVLSKCFRTPHRIILSGSPIQNNLKELWSLFDFIFPGKLGTLTSFMENFSIPIVQGGYSNATDIQVQTAYKCATLLKDTITPYLLRRNKNDVQITIQLPSKNEQVLFCRLGDEQKDEYLRYIKSKDCTEILNKKTNVFKALIYLRKLCNHVDLCIPTHYSNKNNIDKNSYGYLKRSGKMIVVETLLKLWKKQENRVLLFTQSRKMLDIIELFVKSQNYEYFKMDGTTPVTTRNKNVKEFNSNKNIFIFILTTKVGGLGLNLIGANRIIIFDPDWNPSTDMQARERSWRIGQTKSVTIYRLLTAGTIEEKIYHRQIFKQFLTNKVLKDPKQKRFFKTNDLYELFSYNAIENNTTLESTSLFAGTNSEIKKSKIKYSKMDGERIPGLMKKYDSKSVLSDSQQKSDDSNDQNKDDYVLNKLFKSRKRHGGKSAIHTAIQHDLIVNNNDPDFVLVETEAERIASEAIKSLKESRRLCHSAESGIPNLTGVKFGTKSVFLPFSFNNNDNNVKNESDEDTPFSINKNPPLSSASLIERIQMRNSNTVNLNDSNADESQLITPTMENEKFSKLADDLRNYVLYGASKIGEATTEEIIEHFKKKLDKNNTIKFKAILKKICLFHRTPHDGIGFWKLKEDFR